MKLAELLNIKPIHLKGRPHCVSTFKAKNFS